MSTPRPREEYTTLRVPVWLDEAISKRAAQLLEHYETCGSLEQQQVIYLAGGAISDRFGVPKWRVVARWLHQDELKRARQKKYRSRKKKRKKSS